MTADWTANPVTMSVAGMTVTVLYSGDLPQFPGVDQINFVVPNGATSGLSPIVVSVGERESPATMLAIVAR